MNAIALTTGTGTLALAEAVACPRCHAMHYFVSTRTGQTLCLPCSDQVEREREELPS